MTIIVSPFSNSTMRDWPPEHFRELIALLLPAIGEDEVIRVIGTRSQRARAYEIVQDFPADRVVNDCGTMPWDDVLALLRTASCVIGNNSGIAHLGGMYGAPTVCVFGGSHQRSEWRPLGDNVIVVSRALGCSPCHLDHNMTCHYDKLCLREIAPLTVAEAALLAMDRGASGNRPTRERELSEVVG